MKYPDGFWSKLNWSTLPSAIYLQNRILIRNGKFCKSEMTLRFYIIFGQQQHWNNILIEEKLSTVRKIDRAYVRAKILATDGPRIWKF